MMKRLLQSKETKKTLITFGIVIITYIIVEILMLCGLLSNQLQGLLVPICYYVMLAISLNLTVGILGELSLGHAGFACVGVFTGTVFSICMQNVIAASWI